MLFGNWGRQSWWQKTSIAAFLFAASVCSMAVVVAVFVSALSNSNKLSSLGWLTFSVFPLVVVVAIASLARVQQRINLKSPHSLPNKSFRSDEMRS